MMDILGNSMLREILFRAVDRGQLHHSLLFHGPEGVGKRLTAVRLAMYRSCPQRIETGTDCGGGCRSCSRMARGIHPDLFFIVQQTLQEHPEYTKLNCIWADPDDSSRTERRKAEIISIKQMKKFHRQAALRPAEASGLTFIIDGADLMNPEAANAFLKTLEEPPPECLMVLVTHRPDALLPTIRSRCQHLRFRPFTRELLQEALIDRHGMSAEEAGLRARLAGGSLGRALTLDLESYMEKRQLALGLLETICTPGWPSRQALLTAANDLAGNAKKWDAVGRDVPGILRTLVRDVVIRQQGGGSAHLTHAELTGELDEIAGRADRIDPYGVWNCFAEMEDGLRRNLNRRLLCEVLFIKLTRSLIRAEPPAAG